MNSGINSSSFDITCICKNEQDIVTNHSQYKGAVGEKRLLVNLELWIRSRCRLASFIMSETYKLRRTHLASSTWKGPTRGQNTYVDSGCFSCFYYWSYYRSIVFSNTFTGLAQAYSAMTRLAIWKKQSHQLSYKD